MGYSSGQEHCACLAIKVTHDWLQQLEQGNEVCSVFFDLKKAFDSVPHHLLLQRLVQFNTNPFIVQWIRSYLTSRPQLVVVSGEHSIHHDCITWSDYYAHPTFVYHSTTLIFTPGNYSLPENSGTFSVATINTFTMIGDRAQLQFKLSLSNIEYVGIHNLTFLETAPSISGFSIANVHYFIIENCILSKFLDSPSWEPSLLFYAGMSPKIAWLIFLTVHLKEY